MREDFPQYLRELEAKMLKGAEEYGDKSYSKDAYELLEELKSEVIDLSGWGYFLWRRCNDMIHALERVQGRTRKIVPFRNKGERL